MRLRKLYHYLYYKLYCFAIYISDDILNDSKPLITISSLEALLLIECIVWYTVITGNTVSFSQPVWVFLPIGLGITIFNFNFFIKDKRWTKHVAEFKEYDKKNKYKGNIIVFLLITAIISSLIFSFYVLANR